MRRARGWGLLVLLTLLGLAWAGPAVASESVQVTIDPSSAAVELGEKVVLTVTVRNEAPTATPPLVVHLDITDPASSVSVDPEDWTPTLSQDLGVLPSGATRSVEWTIQPISPGTFATYAVALSPGVAELAASDVVAVSVADRPSLDPGGILAVAVAVPAGVGGLLVAQLRWARRGRRRAPAPPSP